MKKKVTTELDGGGRFYLNGFKRVIRLMIIMSFATRAMGSSNNVLFGVGKGTITAGSGLYAPDRAVSDTDPLTKQGQGPLDCVRIGPSSSDGCYCGFSTSSAYVDVRLQTPTSGPLHLKWATSGGHGSGETISNDTGTSFKYKSTSTGAWQTLTSVISQSSSDWGDVVVNVGTISDIKYQCHGGHWCKIVYFNVVQDGTACPPSCTAVANQAADASLTCTTASDSQISACLAGYWKDTTGTADVCTECAAQTNCAASTPNTCSATSSFTTMKICTSVTAGGFYLDLWVLLFLKC